MSRPDLVSTIPIASLTRNLARVSPGIRQRHQQVRRMLFPPLPFDLEAIMAQVFVYTLPKLDREDRQLLHTLTGLPVPEHGEVRLNLTRAQWEVVADYLKQLRVIGK